MISEHNEIEAKLEADDILVSDYCKYMFGTLPTRYECVTGPDTYYTNGLNVVRHREKLNSKTHELTVKRRKTSQSTRDREEIDLHFLERTGVEDVRAFLKATGFKKEFRLVKTAHIFWMTSNGVELTHVIYDVWRDDDGSISQNKRFVEVEAEKGSDSTVAHAKREVNAWVKTLGEVFGPRAPLNDSLYEIYSGKKYLTVE